MKKYRLAIYLMLITNLLLAQEVAEVLPFDKILNQFLNVRDMTISQNGTEAYFTIQSPNQDISQIAYLKKKGSKWSKPMLLPFCDEFLYMEPFLTDNEQKLFFVSDRPLSDTTKQNKDFDIWYVERSNEKAAWSKPINLGKPVNTALNEFYPTLSANNNLYFTMESPNGLGKDDIYYSQWDGKKYSVPTMLDENINSSGYEFNAFVTKQENVLLFTKYQSKDGLGSGDLYISRKGKDGKWQPATNLGSPINTKYMEYCPFYDEATQTLYFTSRRNSIQPKKFKNITAFQQYLIEGENGLSKLYKTKLKLE